MSWIRVFLPRALLALSASAGFVACNADLGVVQNAGLSATTEFDGAKEAVVLSPNAVRVTWDTSPKFSSYEVYVSSQGAPVGTTRFGSFTITGLLPETPYRFKVKGIPVDTANRPRVDGSNKELTGTTWPTFTGVTVVAALSKDRIRVTWGYAPEGPSFKIFVGAGSSIADIDLNNPATTVSARTVDVAKLASGLSLQPQTVYAVVVRATFLDGTSESNSSVITATTSPAIDPLPTIAVDTAVFTRTPAFTVTGASADYRTRFRLAGSVIAEVTGNGTAQVPSAFQLALGSNTIQVSVEQGAYTSQLPDVVVKVRRADLTTLTPAPEVGVGPPQGLGYAQAAGDYNCDGYDDLAVSAPQGWFEPTVGMSSNFASQGPDGGVYVYYGTPTGLRIPNGSNGVPQPQASPAALLDPLLITRPIRNINGSLLGYSNGGSTFGVNLAAGNLNADLVTGNDCDDLVVVGTSVTGASITGNAVANEVWVLFGSTYGPQVNYDNIISNNLATDPCAGTACAPLVLYLTVAPGASASGWGSGLAIGRFHDASDTYGGPDTYLDLAIGAPRSWVGGADKGSVHIYYGGPGGIRRTPYLPTRIDAPAAATVATSFGSFGTSLAAADIDADNIDDLIVGSPGDLNGGTLRGSVYVFGSLSSGVAAANQFPAGIPVCGTALPAACLQLKSPTHPNVNSVYFGAVVAAAGDLNGDALDDFAVGTGSRYPVSILTSGLNYLRPSVNIYYGGNAAANSPQLSLGCVTGDVNGAGGACTVVTAPTHPDSCTPLPAQGGAGTLGSNCKVLDFVPLPSVTPSLSVALQGRNARSVGRVNINAGGTPDDLIIGDPYYHATNRPTGSSIELLYGQANGLNVFGTQVRPLFTTGPDWLGFSVAAGNFNGDSYTDISAGAPRSSTFAGNMSGTVYTFLGTPSGISSGASPTVISANVSKVTTAHPVAPSVAAWTNTTWVGPIGDVNGDGFADAAFKINAQTTVEALGMEVDAVIVFGSSNGLILDSATCPTPCRPLLNPASLTDPRLLPVQSSNDLNGAAIMHMFIAGVGDTNSDGYDELVTTTGYPNPATGYRMVLYMGSPSGPAVAGDAVLPSSAGPYDPRILFSNSSVAPAVDDSLAQGGTYQKLAHGDFNGDGYSDFVGTSYITSGISMYGLVIYGGANGLQSDGVLTYPGTEVVAQTPCSVPPGGDAAQPVCKAQRLNPPNANAMFMGSSVAVGDFNGDSYMDVALGAARDDIAAADDNGTVYVFWGSPTGLKYGVSDTGTSGTLIIPPRLLVENPRWAGDNMASVGDVNGDGFDELLIGASYTDMPAGQSGGAFMFYGCGNGVNTGGPITAGCPQGFYRVTGDGVEPDPLNDVVHMADSCDGTGCKILTFMPTAAEFDAATSNSFYYNYYGTNTMMGLGDLHSSASDTGPRYNDVAIGGYYYIWYCTAPGCTQSQWFAGNLVIYSGTPQGLKFGTLSRNPACANGACNPYLVQPPASDFAALQWFFLGYKGNQHFNTNTDFNGDGYRDVLIPTNYYQTPVNRTINGTGFFMLQ